MSTIRADSVAPSAGGTARNLPRGVAAAWGNLNGTGTIAVRDSQNVSSVTDVTTGTYSFNYTASMSAARAYIAQHMIEGDEGGNGATTYHPQIARSAGALAVNKTTVLWGDNGATADVEVSMLLTHGPLA